MLNDYRMNPFKGPNAQYGVNNTATGFTNPPQNIMVDINIYSSNGAIDTSGNYTGGSARSTNQDTLPTGNLVKSNGVYYGGYAIYSTCLDLAVGNNWINVLLAPSATDILNTVDVWVTGYANMGTPLVTVVQTAGSVSNLAQLATGPYAPSATPPTVGYMKIPVMLTVRAIAMAPA